jgi:PPOX class probable F420-dependent enzyme
MHVMDEAEYHRFLTEGTRTGKLATTRADGRPHVAPVWFDLDDDGTVALITGADSLKGKALRRDPRVCLCVDGGHRRLSRCTAQTTAPSPRRHRSPAPLTSRALGRSAW